MLPCLGYAPTAVTEKNYPKEILSNSGTVNVCAMVRQAHHRQAIIHITPENAQMSLKPAILQTVQK